VAQQRLHRIGGIVGANGNPLCRQVDKVEKAILIGLIAAFLVVAPLVSVLAARQAGATAGREMRAEQGWKEVPAVLTQNADAGIIGLDGEWDTAWVQARWIAPDGARGSGFVAVALNARAGQRVPVWVTASARLTRAPVTAADVTEREVVAALVAAAALAGLLSVTAVTSRVLANRRRMAGWTRAWEAAGRRWSALP
jgi:FtsH-binding integral membrane protein